ncbi:MAG TPA: MBL fold metallo-hydrolase [Vicinamibacterales bacterium]|nr:MBL fold metallo-hydrolase [Vicinamibacterales bacterium]
MRKLFVPALALLALTYAMLAQAQRGGGPLAMPPVPGSLPSRNFEKVADGVYYATSTGSITTVSNAVVVVNEDDVLVVDPGVTAGAATALVADIKTLTNKPIKYVVDTHYHYDHAFGNQVFGPEVTIIGHDTVRQRLTGPTVLKQRTYMMNSTAAIATRFTQLKRQIAEAKDAQERAVYERQLAIHQQYADEQPKLRPTPPNATLSRDMTLHRGSREIQIRFLGRAHTDGDIVVFLPKERMIATGDMITSGLSYTGDAFIKEWPATLEGVMALDFDTVLPGHGGVFKGKDHLRNLQAYWRDFYQQAIALRKQGVSPEEAAKRIDLTKHAGAIPAAKAPGVDVRGVDRLYDLEANPNAPVR